MCEGILHCSDPACYLEYPVIDRIPILVPDARAYIASQLPQILERSDLSPLLRSAIGDSAGPNSAFDLARQHLSTYAWDGWAEFDPAEAPEEQRPGAVARCLAAGLKLAGGGTGPALDLGCAVGRSTAALAAATDALVLGIDMNFAMLRLAQRILATGEVRYERRRIGVVYDERIFPVALAGRERIDFWCCDALALPFAPAGFGLVAALNLLDCLPAPRDLLIVLETLLHPGGRAVLATPYDWSPAVTRFEAWIGGHSQRSDTGGAAAPLLRQLLTKGAHPLSAEHLRLLGEIEDFTWQTRLHERSSVSYSVHIAAIERLPD